MTLFLAFKTTFSHSPIKQPSHSHPSNSLFTFTHQAAFSHSPIKQPFHIHPSNSLSHSPIKQPFHIKNEV